MNNSGINGNEVTSIKEDSKGNKWIGTYGGLSKFDGVSWHSYDTSSVNDSAKIVNAIIIDKNDNVWTSSYNELRMFNQYWKIFSSYNIQKFTIDSKGKIWGVSSNTIVGIENNNIEKIPIDNNFSNYNLNNILVDQNDTKWITSNKGIIKISTNSNWESIIPKDKDIVGNYTTDIKMDKKGNIWVGSTSGLFKFDGINWVNFNKQNSNLIDDNINVVEIEGDSLIWIGTPNGLSVYDGVNFNNYTINNSMVPSNNISSILIDSKGDRWVGAYANGIIKISNTICNNIPVLAIDTNQFFCEGQNIILNSKSKGEVTTYQWSSNQLSLNSLQNNFNLGYLSSDIVYEITLIGTDINGCTTLPVSVKIKVHPRPKLKIILSDSILHRNNEPVKLVGYPSGGKFTGIGVENNIFNPQNVDLGTQSIHYEYTDSIGCLGEIDKSIIVIDTTKRINTKKFELFDTTNSGLKSNIINNIKIDNLNNFWIGTNYGLSKYDGKNWVTYDSLNSGLSGNRVYSIAIEDTSNLLWVANNVSVSTFDNKNWKTIVSGNPNYSVTIDNMNNKWIGSSNGLLKVTNDTLISLNQNSNGLSSNLITCLNYLNYGMLSNNLWIGTNQGISVLDTKYDYIVVYDSLNSKLTDDYVNTITSIYDNSIWVGTNKGLIKINSVDKYTFAPAVYEIYNTSNSGLLNDTIISLFSDNSGVLYIGTKNGLTTFNGKKWETILSKKRGNNNYEILSMATDKLGNNWFGTNNGLLKVSNTDKSTLIYDLESKSKVLVYPNPVSSILTIDSKNLNVKSVSFIDVLGKSVLQQELKGVRNEVNLEGISKGMYVVSFFNDQNEIISSQKLSIE